MGFSKKKIFILIPLIIIVVFLLITSLNKTEKSSENVTSEENTSSNTQNEENSLAHIRTSDRLDGMELPDDILAFIDCEEDAYYGFSLFDLNADGAYEYIVSPGDRCSDYGRGASGNGPILLFRWDSNKWDMFSELNGNSLAIKKTKSYEYYDIEGYHHMSAMDGIATVYKYDGQKYNESESFDKDAKTSNLGKYNDYYIGQDEIIFYRENGLDYSANTLDSEEAPKVFNSGIFHIKELNTGTKDTYYLITTHYSDHGGLASDYAIVYSPDQGKILYETNDRVKDGWYNGIYATEDGGFAIHYYYTHLIFGMRGKLEYYQYYKIDTENKTVVSANTDHKEVFQKLLDNLKDECITEITAELYKDNEKMTFEEVRDTYGEDFVCKLPNEGSRPSYNPNLMPDETLITPKIYFLYKSALENIVNGKEVDLTKLYTN